MSNLELRFTYVDADWLAAVLFALACGLAVAVYLRCFRRGRSWRLPLVLSALRCIAVAVALLLLLRPILRFDVVTRRDERLVVLLDTSRSMSIADSVGGEERLASALRFASSEALSRLAEIFRLELRSFSGPGSLSPVELAGVRGEPRPGAWSAEVAADGHSTDLAGAWEAVDPDDGPVKSIVLLSDGRDHGRLGSEAAETDADLPAIPVYAVGIGSGEPPPADLAWTKVSTERRVLRGSRVEVRAAVRSRGLPVCATEVVILREGEEVGRRRVKLEPGDQELKFDLLADRPGRLVYELSLGPQPDEAVSENNRTHLVLEVTDRPLQVLFFDGRARWQSKFARRALARDPSLNVTSVVRLSDDRLLQQGRPPVNLPGGLPAHEDAWGAFDVLVLGNVASGDLPDSLQRILLGWLSEGRGGLVYCGGGESHRFLSDAPLGQVLPADPGDGHRTEGPFRVVPEAAALAHPVTRRLLVPFMSERRSGPPAVGELFESGAVRPGAEVLLSASKRDDSAGSAELRRAGRRPILLATRQYGAGRVVAWFTDSDWRWVMAEPGREGERLFNVLWGRMVRWAGRRDRAPGAAGALELSRSEARVGEQVALEVTDGGGIGRTVVEVEDPKGRRSGVAGAIHGDRWSGHFAPELPGVHVFEVVSSEVSTSGGEAVLVVRPDSREMENTEPDWDLLRTIAERTGGEFFTLAEAGALAERIIDDSPGVLSRVELGAERGWWLYALLVICLTIEWALRRRIYTI